MNEPLKQWFDLLSSSPAKKLQRSVMVEGSRDVHLGPKMERAQVTFLIEAADRLEVVFQRRPDSTEEERFLSAAIFGFLDVSLVDDLRPWREIRISIKDFVVDPIDSSVSAFRHAGRDAARRFLKAVSEGTLTGGGLD